MSANQTLELGIEGILFSPPGRPSRKPLVRYKSFRDEAESWTTPRRIVATVEHTHRRELFPFVDFIVTNMPSRGARMSFHRFRANEVRLQLSVLAYNLGTSGADWSCRRGSSAGRSRVSSSGWCKLGPGGEACAVRLAPVAMGI